MERQSRVHLDHPSIRGRVRTPQLSRGRAQQQTDLDGRVTQPNPAPKHVTPVKVAPSKPLSTPPKRGPLASAKQAPLQKNRTVPMSVSPHETAHLPRQSRSGVLRRQMVKVSAKKYRPHKKRSYKFVFVGGIALFILLLGSSAGVLTYKKVHHDYEATAVLAKQTQVKMSKSTDDGTSSNDMPSEDNPPRDISNYVVPDTRPRFLKIEKLGVFARVLRVSTDSDNSIKGPSNIYDVGWYDNSSRPGENGTSLIDGHVAGQNNRGVFFGLGTLKKGDKIVIERGDGKKLSYTVVTVEQASFDNLDMHKVMNSVIEGKPGLNLMTASGRYNVRTNEYEKRVIVYAVQD